MQFLCGVFATCFLAVTVKFFFDWPLFPVKRLHFCSMRDEFTLLLTVTETVGCFTMIWGLGGVGWRGDLRLNLYYAFPLFIVDLSVSFSISFSFFFLSLYVCCHRLRFDSVSR